MRQAIRRNPSRQRVSSGASLPAPVEGWDTSESLAGMNPKRAILMDNFFPQANWVEVRRGHIPHADTDTTSPVESLLPYHGTFSSAMFAASAGAIYDITSGETPDDPSLSGLANNRWQWINVANSGGSYLWICNGADVPKVYNGATWADVEITGIAPEQIVNVDLHKGRIWGVMNASTSVTYATVIDAIQGAFDTYELGALMSHGGYVQAVASWSRDGGDGPDDYLVFVTSRGQVLIFSGLFPADANSWGLVGVYNLGAPIGRRCLLKMGADLIVNTIDGAVSLSAVVGQDRAVSGRAALTQRIRRAMTDAARLYGANFGWDMTSYAHGTAFILNVPLAENDTAHQYVMNTMTGAWCRYTGQDANCWAVFQERLYFGGNDGMVYQADASGQDSTGSIVADIRTSFQSFGNDASVKAFKMVQALINRDGDVSPAIGIDTDFKDEAVLSVFPANVGVVARWDEAIWDVDIWPEIVLPQTQWLSVDGIGQNASIRMRVELAQATEGQYSTSLLFQINGFNMLMEKGGFL